MSLIHLVRCVGATPLPMNKILSIELETIPRNISGDPLQNLLG